MLHTTIKCSKIDIYFKSGQKFIKILVFFSTWQNCLKITFQFRFDLYEFNQFHKKMKSVNLPILK